MAHIIARAVPANLTLVATQSTLAAPTAGKGDVMADRDDRDGERPIRPELNAEEWDVANCDVVLEEDGMRITVELAPRAEGAENTKMEFFTRPF